jgi:hypothetical protein
VAWVVPLAVALAACSNGATTDQTVGTTTTGSNAASGTTEANADGPQFGSEEFGLTMEALALRVEQVEGLIGQCMREAGFEYVPVDFVTVRRAMTADKTAPGLSDDEYRAQFGYGISTQLNKPLVDIGLGAQNARILATLAEADKVAYKRSLWGENEEATFAFSLEAEDFSQTGGCTLEAVEQAFKPDELSVAFVNPGDVLIQQDPRVVAALQAWSECVREEGFDYNNPDEIEGDITERYQAITQGQDPESLTGAALDALTELQGEERAIAQLDFECAEDLLEPVIEEVEAEIYGAPQG